MATSLAISHRFRNDCEEDGDSRFWPLDRYTAASLGDVSFFVRYDVGKLKAEVSIPNSAGWTPLMYACARGHSLLVNYLTISGANRGWKTKSGVNSLMLAVASGDLPTVKAVFDPSDLEERDYRKWSPLFYAVHFTREKCVGYLMSKGANVNVADYQNETPLMVAIKLERETMVEMILRSATNLTVKSFKQESALMLANESHNPKIKSIVRERHQYLTSLRKDGEMGGEEEEEEGPSTGKDTPGATTPNTKREESIPRHCSPTPLKQQLKSQFKLGRTLTFSPNRSLQANPPPQSSPARPIAGNFWKVSIPKKFWSPQLKPYGDVEQLLSSLGLHNYWPIFRDEEVDFETLLTLNEENLKELGIVMTKNDQQTFGQINTNRL